MTQSIARGVDVRAVKRTLEREIGPGWRAQPFGPMGWALGHPNNGLSVIVSQSSWDGVEWLHASVAHVDRDPSYVELCALKEAVFGPERFAYQVFATDSRHVNIHEHALHLWGRADGVNALPDFGAWGTI